MMNDEWTKGFLYGIILSFVVIGCAAHHIQNIAIQRKIAYYNEEGNFTWKDLRTPTRPTP